MQRLVTAIAITVLVGGLVGCSDDGVDPSATASPPAPTAGGTAAVTTAAAAIAEGAVDSFVIPIIDVVFAENECVVDLPLDIPSGTAAFVLTRVGDTPGAEVRIGPLLEGFTFDDLLDQQLKAGGDGVYWPKPDWLGLSVFSFEVVDVELTDHQDLYTYTVTSGSHALWLVNGSPPGLWPCGPVNIY